MVATHPESTFSGPHPVLDKWPSPVAKPVAAMRQLVDAGALCPPAIPLCGRGATMERFRALAAIAAHDVALARLCEGHVDALAILTEAWSAGRGPGPDGVGAGSLLGVWAAGPPGGLVASAAPGGGFILNGSKSWCSGAGSLTHALVTAVAEGDQPGTAPSLFLVDLCQPGVQVDRGSWPAVGMARTDTFDVTFAAVAAGPDSLVGERGWYLHRPGFWQGGTGVAACWWGASRGVAAPLFDRAADSDDPHARAAHGAVAAHLWSMEAALAACARSFDDDPRDSSGTASRKAQLTRLCVERSASEVIRLTGEATGAGPLCHDAAHAKRVADLTVYLRQHHASRDAEALSGELSVLGWPS